MGELKWAWSLPRLPNRSLVALSSLVCLYGPLVPCVSAFMQTTVDRADVNLRFVIDAKGGRPTQHVYDVLNRRVRTIFPAAPSDLNGDGLLSSNEQTVITSTQTGYDELGRRISDTAELLPLLRV